MTYVPSPQELEAGAEHLLYELQMLSYVAGRLVRRDPEDPGAPWSHNALVEALAIHARNLIDFIYTAPRQDDMAADHYMPVGPSWSQVRPPLPAILTGVRERAHKQIAHLTYHRTKVTPADKAWIHGEISKALGEVIRFFLDKADTSKLGRFYMPLALEAENAARGP